MELSITYWWNEGLERSIQWLLESLFWCALSLPDVFEHSYSCQQFADCKIFEFWWELSGVCKSAF